MSEEGINWLEENSYNSVLPSSGLESKRVVDDDFDISPPSNSTKRRKVGNKPLRQRTTKRMKSLTEPASLDFFDLSKGSTEGAKGSSTVTTASTTLVESLLSPAMQVPLPLGEKYVTVNNIIKNDDEALDEDSDDLEWISSVRDGRDPTGSNISKPIEPKRCLTPPPTSSLEESLSEERKSPIKKRTTTNVNKSEDFLIYDKLTFSTSVTALDPGLQHVLRVAQRLHHESPIKQQRQTTTSTSSTSPRKRQKAHIILTRKRLLLNGSKNASLTSDILTLNIPVDGTFETVLVSAMSHWSIPPSAHLILLDERGGRIFPQSSVSTLIASLESDAEVSSIFLQHLLDKGDLDSQAIKKSISIHVWDKAEYDAFRERSASRRQLRLLELQQESSTLDDSAILSNEGDQPLLTVGEEMVKVKIQDGSKEVLKLLLPVSATSELIVKTYLERKGRSNISSGSVYWEGEMLEGTLKDAEIEDGDLLEIR